MVRRSQSSNPRSVVVLTSGTDWGTRAAGQKRSSGAETPIPQRQPAKIKALQQAVRLANLAIDKKHWTAARYALSRARTLANALPANVAVREREKLSAARKRHAARNTPAAKNARQAKAKAAPAKRAGGKKPAPKKPTAKKAAQKPKPAPVRDLGDRFINRAALGYTETKGS
ncbi:hypothetical protein [Streptomyces sp. HB132]|uniref:hypothetical protein n=1 Tax=Streptomyces sp. HB132 TaxID=767388 RepID=UPI0019619585|nr:hypothetical protein [Streptomyces sp. HB132]MBM7440542.1 membrane protein involved in colicin uptake [Streptomyces sp. HB132]